LMISCEKASFLVSKSQDEKLTCKESLDMHMHLAGCKFCRRYKKHIDFMTDRINNYEAYTVEEQQIMHLTDQQKANILKHISNSNDSQ